MSATAAAQIVADELMVDGNARLNLATFVTTWMEPEAQRLMANTFEKNAIDKDEYPADGGDRGRCVSILARLWKSADADTRSAPRRSGRARRRCWRACPQVALEGPPASGGRGDRSPNLVMGANVQVCWEKFCRYFDVEPRLVPVDARRYHLTPDPATAHCDENTIGVVAILGSTYDGSYEPVAGSRRPWTRSPATAGRTSRSTWTPRAAASSPRSCNPAGLGLQAPARVSINASGAQVRPRLPGGRLGDVARRRALPDDLIFG